MTALARSIGTQDTVLYLSSSLDVGSVPAPFLIDAECVLVTGGDMQSQVFVSRAQFGTAAATHDIGATLVSGWGSTNGPVTLAQVLANGNDTGGVGIVNVQANAVSSINAVDPTTGKSGAADATASVSDGDFTLASHHAIVSFGDSDATTQATAVGGGAASAATTATTDGSGNADASTSATSVDGNATATTTATASGTGAADASANATASGGEAHVLIAADDASANVRITASDDITLNPTGNLLFDGGSGAGGVTFGLSVDGDIGDGNGVFLLEPADFKLTINGALLLIDLPTSDPGVAGQVYSDGVPSAGVPKVLKISGG